MKKVLIHKNSGNPIYIARCEEGIYHVIYQDEPIRSHNTIGLAISNAMNEFIACTPRAIDGWHQFEAWVTSPWRAGRFNI